MAGDRIKMRNDLPEDPAVIGIAAILSIDEFSVVGRLHKFWAWADRQSRDGHAVGVTKAWIDRYVHCDGFASALESFGWLAVTDRGISIPNFDSHNGESAKARCTATKRQQKSRAKASGNADESDSSRSDRDKSVTREEKRREEITPPTPKGELAGFSEFWAAWPASGRKGSKGACLAVWKKHKVEFVTDEVIRHLDSLKTSSEWTKNGGEFIPAPLVYLNQRRWDGAEESQQAPVDRFAGAI